MCSFGFIDCADTKRRIPVLTIHLKLGLVDLVAHSYIGRYFIKKAASPGDTCASSYEKRSKPALARYAFRARRVFAAPPRAFEGLGATPGTFRPKASAMRRARSTDSLSALSSSLGEWISRLLEDFVA